MTSVFQNDEVQSYVDVDVVSEGVLSFATASTLVSESEIFKSIDLQYAFLHKVRHPDYGYMAVLVASAGPCLMLRTIK